MSYTNAVRMGRNISLAGALNGLKMTLYTACPAGVTNLRSCSVQHAFDDADHQMPAEMPYYRHASHSASMLTQQNSALGTHAQRLPDVCVWSSDPYSLSPASPAAACQFAPL